MIDKELDEKGIFTYAELMGQILAEHYGTKPKPVASIKIKEVEAE